MLLFGPNFVLITFGSVETWRTTKQHLVSKLVNDQNVSNRDLFELNMLHIALFNVEMFSHVAKAVNKVLNCLKVSKNVAICL